MSPQPIHQLASTEALEYTPDMAYDDWQESAEPIRRLDSVNDVHILEEALSGSLQTPQCLQTRDLSSSTSTDCFFGICEENYTPAEHETVLGEDCPMINSYPVFPNAITFKAWERTRTALTSRIRTFQRQRTFSDVISTAATGVNSQHYTIFGVI